MQRLSIFLFFLSACNRDNKKVNTNPVIEFGESVKVEMIRYSGNIMEPFLSRDGTTLLFNPNFAIEQFMPVCLNFGK